MAVIRIMYLFFWKRPKCFKNAHKFLLGNWNKQKGKESVVMKTKKSHPQQVELNLKGVILTGNTLCYAVIIVILQVLIPWLCISSIAVHSLCVWASLWLKEKSISISWKTNYWYRRSLLSIAGVFLCCWTSTEKVLHNIWEFNLKIIFWTYNNTKIYNVHLKLASSMLFILL